MVQSQGVAQSGSAPGLEPGGRRFESYRPDHFHDQTTGGFHATQLWRPAVLSKPRASGGGGYASETQVRRGDRVVHSDKELIEKLGRNDLCPCGSGRRFQKMLPAIRPLRRERAQLLCSGLAANSLKREGDSKKAITLQGFGELAERQGIAVLTRRDRKVGQVRLLHSPPLPSQAPNLARVAQSVEARA
jgi:SEC-C motif-containing protein